MTRCSWLEHSPVSAWSGRKRITGTLVERDLKSVTVVPDPGQGVDVPATATGLPVRLSDGSGVESVDLLLEYDPALLLVGQPTRGVDIGAIEFIHRRLVEMRDAGKAILLISAELDEILGLSDRILVMFQGRIVGEMTAAEADPRRIGLMMAGIDEGSTAHG